MRLKFGYIERCHEKGPSHVLVMKLKYLNVLTKCTKVFFIYRQFRTHFKCKRENRMEEELQNGQIVVNWKY